MKWFGFFSFLTATLWAFGAEETPKFLEYTEGCYQANSHFREDGDKAGTAKAATLGEFIDWISVKKVGDYWVEKHTNADAGVSHFSFYWKKLPEKDMWLMEQRSPFAKAPIYQCVAPVTEVELKPTKEKIYVHRCEANGAPKPARDSRVNPRNDYKTLNRIHVTRFSKNAVSDVQRNTRIKEDGKPLSTEEGWVEYVRLEKGDCKNRGEDNEK